MKKIVEPKKMIFPKLLNNYSNIDKTKKINIYPRMPKKQIQHYINIANKKKNKISIQLKPSSHLQYFTEITGKIALITKENLLLLKIANKKKIHLVQEKNIHHLRLSD